LRGGALPAALLCAALGFALSFAPRRALPVSGVLLAVIGAGCGVLVLPSSWREPIFAGCWISVAVTALLVHLPRGVGPRLALAVAANAGLWAGAVIAEAGAPSDLLKALPWVLLCLPGGWMARTSRQIVIKIVASWLIAVSILAGALPMVPTPGYAPDHME
jgi:hypothetical protein